MDVGKLFSWKGRVRRTDFWGMYLVYNALYVVFWKINGARIMDVYLANKLDENPLSRWELIKTEFTPIWIPWIIVISIVVWLETVTEIKRWHDREKSGWWSLIRLVIPIGSVWTWVELGALEGTDGPNKYGAPNSGSPFGLVPKGSVPPASLASGGGRAQMALPQGAVKQSAAYQGWAPAAVPAQQPVQRQNPAPAPLHAVCPQCGKPNTPPSFFCAWCGYSLRK